MPHTKHAFLSHYPAVHSYDSEFARDRLFAVYGANGFESTTSNFGLHANFVQLSGIGLSYCCYDQPTALTFPEAGFIRQFFSIAGSARFTCGNAATAAIGPWTRAIPGTAALKLNFGESYSQLVLRIETASLERTVKALIGEDSDRRLEFIDGKEDAVSQLLIRKSVFELVAELDAFGTRYSPLAMAELERMIIARFLFAHQHSYSHLLWRQPREANRSVVDRVEAFIEANWDKPLDVSELAAVANVSIRTLFREFLRAGKRSPAEFAKGIRLRHANSMLKAKSETTTVTGVALRCGFQNVGRFARDYSLLFGELPSETLKRGG